MPNTRKVLDAVNAELASEPRIGPHHSSIALAFEDGVLTMEGEVASVAAKKLALERAAGVPEIVGIVDRLHVTPAQRMGDGQIRDLLRDSFVGEPAFADYALWESVKGKNVRIRVPPADCRGTIEAAVRDGVIILNGEVQGLDDKCLAGILAWWIPGSRDVVNGLAVEPPEEDSDDALAEAVRLALEKDRLVDASQVRVGVRRAIVTLSGLLPSDSQRDMAESDAWFVFGVDKVVNNIEVKPF